MTRKGQILAEGSAKDGTRTILKELCIKVEKMEEKPSVKEKEKERDRRGRSRSSHKAKQ